MTELRDSIPRWHTEDIDEHLTEKSRGYEAALNTLETEVTLLRNQVQRLEEENERLKWELLGWPPIMVGS